MENWTDGSVGTVAVLGFEWNWLGETKEGNHGK
jgi:hypothetical protein